MSKAPDGWLTRRAVTALTRLAEGSEGADRDWALGLLAEVDEVSPGLARLRWAFGGIWMLISGSISGRRIRFAALARQPARWSQRVLALLLLPYAYWLLLAYAFTQLDYEIGDPRGPAFVAAAVSVVLTAILAWWRPIPAMVFGFGCWLAQVAIWLAPSGAVLPDGGTPGTAERIRFELPLLTFTALPMLTLMASIAALSLAPRIASGGVRRRPRDVAMGVVTWIVLLALIGLGPFSLTAAADLLLGDAAFGVMLVFSWLVAVVVVPICVLLSPLAALSRPLARAVDPAEPAPAG
jgi:hypothetical protein